MPELPDVEVFKKEAEKALDKEIETFHGKESKLLSHTEKEINGFLRGKSFHKAYRRGKYLFLITNSPKAVAMHFGMTGVLTYSAKEKDPPPYTLCSFYLKNQHGLHYISRRKLGKVELTRDYQEYIRQNEIGTDALEISKKDFLKKLNESKSMVKRFLTDQSALSGIGNIYADEILFQVKLHPKEKTYELTDNQKEELYEQVRKVLKTAVEKQADVKKFPRHFLLPVRKEGEKCPRCERSIEKISVSGRTGYYCKHCQKPG